MVLPLLASAVAVPSLSETVVYEANLRAEGPKGGFAALTRRLGSIRALGVNVLWLMPVQPVGKLRSAGGLGSPYAPRDYAALNPEFGTVAEFRTLIAEAHRRKMAVILDWVANHTAWDHPWLKAHPDWYTHDAKGEIAIPAGTNWQDVADLDYTKPALRAAMIAAMEGWITRYGVDGFRCDTADWVPADFWKEAIARLRVASPHPLFVLAEGFRKENVASGFDVEYGWPFYDRLVAIYKGEKASTLAEAATKEKQDGGRHLRFVTNHDKSAWEGAPTDFFKSPEGVRTATIVTTLYSGGIPLVYSGQEVAWRSRIPIFDRSTIDWSSNAENRRWLAALYTLRRTHPALREGDLRDVSTEDAIVFVRRAGTDEALVVANVRDHAATVALPSGTWHDGFSGEKVGGSSLALAPFAFRVLLR